MKVLALEHETPLADGAVSATDWQPHLKAEAARAWELYQAGIIRELYFRPDQHTAVLVLECASIAEAQHVLNSLPLVSAGLITFEIIPLIAYSGFSRLFHANETT
jgi:muconolactone delta-isomerase